jgi:hypothetical protein
MKKSLLRGVAVAAMTGMALTVWAQDSNPDQSQYPTILEQPVDQCVPLGASVTFSAVATNMDYYQWYKNNVAIDGQTNSSITISGTGINDVGYYGASVIKDGEAVPTRLACLNVYTSSSASSSASSVSTLTRNKMSAQSMSMMSPMDLGGGGVITVFGLPIMNNGGSGTCPGKYSGYVNFTKSPSQGWGWAPTVGAIHTATDTNRMDTKVTFMGNYGDQGCASNSVTVSNPISPVYRFTIVFPPNSVVPTNVYTITLEGFDP